MGLGCVTYAQSLKNKLDEFAFIFESSGIDIVCISETWFNKDLLDGFLNIEGYVLYRADRSSHAGGCAIYTRQSLKCKVLAKSDDTSQIEFLFLEVSQNDKKLLIGTAYRPHHRINYDNFIDTLANISVPYSDIILTGDFNSNLIQETSLTENMESLGLFPVNIAIPTHFTDHSSTLLDLIFVCKKSKCLLYDQLPAPQFSRHDLLFLIYDFSVITSPSVTQFRDFKSVYYTALFADCCDVDWSPIFRMPNVNDQVLYLHQNIQSLFESHVPLKTKIIRPSEKPWFTQNIKTLIHKRDMAYKKWKRYRIPDDYNSFKRMQNLVTKSVRDSKRSYYHNKVLTAGSSKTTWNLIKDLGLGNRKNQQINTDLNELNKKFTTFTSDNSVPDNMQPTCDIPYSSSIYNIYFSFNCVNQCDVLSSILAVKSNAVGLDGICPRFIKVILPVILPFITHIFNTCLMSSQFPDLWKVAKIIPIPKSNSDFRPVAILPFLSKALEIIMYRQMNNYFTMHKLLTERQSGFRAKRGCISALLDVSEHLRSKLDKGDVTFLLLLDHSKAFDNVNHLILVYKLTNFYNFSSSATRLIASYLNGRSQSVCSGTSASSLLPVDRGVPQGSVLGPFLFSIYINDFPSILNEVETHIYADDIQLYKSSQYQDVDNCIKALNENTSKISAWAAQNKLSINPHKSQCLVIYKKKINTENLPKITIDQTNINYVQNAKNLGIVFNKTLSWEDHINQAIGKIYCLLRSLWDSQTFLPKSARMLIAKTHLVPTLLYGCEIYANCNSIQMQKLTILFNNIARYVFCLNRFDHVSTFSIQLYGLSFKCLLKYRVLLYLHKIIYTKEPSYLYEKLKFSRSARNNNIIPVRHTTLISEKQFFVYAVRLWNSLPSNIQNIANTNRFKNQLQNYLK